MLKKLINKKVSVGMTMFTSIKAFDPAIKYYEGVIVDCDDNFIVFDDGSMLNIKYIHSIEVK